MVNAAVIGYGFAGRCFHSYLIGLAKGMSVHAIATRAPERQQQAKEHYPEAKIYANIDQALADDAVDLVVLATPHDVHAELAIQAMDAGKHVVTDKIMCMNAQEAESMIVAGERNEVLLSIFHNRRWDWDYLTVKQIIEDGLLGDPYLYQVAIMRHGKPGGWRGSKAQSGGILFDVRATPLLVDAATEMFSLVHASAGFLHVVRGSVGDGRGGRGRSKGDRGCAGRRGGAPHRAHHTAAQHRSHNAAQARAAPARCGGVPTHPSHQ